MPHEKDQEPTPRSWPAGRLSNLIVLIASFGIGQGAIFFSQSWLVAHGHLATLGIFAGHFAFSTLALVLIDLGGSRTLAYLAAAGTNADADADADDSLWPRYWGLVAWRLVLVVAATAVALPLLFGNGGEYSGRYVISCAPGYLAWCFNLTGILDGRRQSGVNGIANGVPYVLTGAALLLFFDNLDRLALATGLAFSMGIVLSVALQYYALSKTIDVMVVRPSSRVIWTAGRDSLLMLGTIAPGQVYFRLQILLCTQFLGIEVTGVYLYGRQIINAVLQLVYFMWRVEFATMTATARHGVMRALKHAVPGVVVTCIVTAVTVAANFLVRESGEGAPYVAVNSVFFQLPVLLSLTAFQLFMQLTLASGMMSSLTLAALASAISGVILSLALFFVPSLTVLIWAEVVSHLVGIACLIFALRSRTNKSPRAGW